MVAVQAAFDVAELVGIDSYILVSEATVDSSLLKLVVLFVGDQDDLVRISQFSSLVKS